ncbi:MAG: CRISPR-associated endonuclease Cas2 [Bacteroidota bacterium]
MARKKLYIICYDIEHNKRRTKFAKFLEDEGGERSNYSVFELMLSKKEYARILTKVPEYISPKRDRIAIYPVCKQCYKFTEYIPEFGPMPAKAIIEA